MLAPPSCSGVVLQALSMLQNSETTSRTASFGGRVVSGSIWSTIQILANKMATVGATIVFAHFLEPGDFGAANIATSLGAFIFILAPWVFNDILIARPREFARLAGTAVWVSLGFGLVSTTLLLALTPMLQQAHPLVEGLWGLLCVAATRPIADALISVPWARLRLDLQYRTLAILDGGLQLAWTLAAVGMAVGGCRALVIVLPPIAVLFFRATAYWILTWKRIPLRPDRLQATSLSRTFLVATCGQYMNNIIQILELLVLQWLAPESTVGLFAFAFMLSSQTNAIIGAQISNVLQPVFSQIRDEPDRQIAGFVRSLRYMGMFAVPIAVIQAAAGPSIFMTLFSVKWAGSVPSFLALCIAQGFMFLGAPTVVLLKAQGRFRAFLVWQAMQVALGGSIMALAVMLGSEPVFNILHGLGLADATMAAPALAISIASAIIWAASCPLAIGLATRTSRDRRTEALRAIGIPWVVSLPIAVGVGLSPLGLERAFLPQTSAWICMLVVAPVGLVACIAILARGDAELRAALAPRWSALHHWMTRRNRDSVT